MRDLRSALSWLLLRDHGCDDVAALVVKAIVKNQPRVFAGKDSKAMDRIYRISPSYATGLVAKQMSELLKDK